MTTEWAAAAAPPFPVGVRRGPLCADLQRWWECKGGVTIRHCRVEDGGGVRGRSAAPRKPELRSGQTHASEITMCSCDSRTERSRQTRGTATPREREGGGWGFWGSESCTAKRKIIKEHGSIGAGGGRRGSSLGPFVTQ